METVTVNSRFDLFKLDCSHVDEEAFLEGDALELWCVNTGCRVVNERVADVVLVVVLAATTSLLRSGLEVTETQIEGR